MKVPEFCVRQFGNPPMLQLIVLVYPSTISLATQTSAGHPTEGWGAWKLKFCRPVFNTATTGSSLRAEIIWNLSPHLDGRHAQRRAAKVGDVLTSSCYRMP
jgi:hypothetical protein